MLVASIINLLGMSMEPNKRETVNISYRSIFDISAAIIIAHLSMIMMKDLADWFVTYMNW